LETIASSRAVVERAQAMASTRPHSSLHALKPGEIYLSHVHQAYKEKDVLATEVVQAAGQALGTAIANLIGILNIQSIILSGDMTVFGDSWLTSIRHSVNQSALTALADKTEIKFSCLTENEVIQGASALLLARELGISPEPNLIAHVNGGRA
jgi:predicted NBD/HSP70 family sugar kinase